MCVNIAAILKVWRLYKRRDRLSPLSSNVHVHVHMYVQYMYNEHKSTIFILVLSKIYYNTCIGITWKIMCTEETTHVQPHKIIKTENHNNLENSRNGLENLTPRKPKKLSIYCMIHETVHSSTCCYQETDVSMNSSTIGRLSMETRQSCDVVDRRHEIN